MNKVCATCKWLESIPFGEMVCMNDNSEYADCPTEQPTKDTCDEWEEREGA